MSWIKVECSLRIEIDQYTPQKEEYATPKESPSTDLELCGGTDAGFAMGADDIDWHVSKTHNADERLVDHNCLKKTKIKS